MTQNQLGMTKGNQKSISTFAGADLGEVRRLTPFPLRDSIPSTTEGSPHWYYFISLINLTFF